MGGGVQSLCLILCDPMDCRVPGYSVLHYFPSLLKFMFIESVIPSNHFIFCHHLLLLPSIFPSIRVFPNESALGIKWPKYWRFNFSVSPFTEYSGLISFRIDSLISLVSKGVSRVLRALSSKASILRLSVLPTLTSVHDYWKNHSFDYTGFCWQSDVSAF